MLHGSTSHSDQLHFPTSYLLIERQITVKTGLKLPCHVDLTGPLGGASLSGVLMSFCRGVTEVTSLNAKPQATSDPEPDVASSKASICCVCDRT